MNFGYPPILALISATLLTVPLAHAEDVTAPAAPGCTLPAKRMERLELIFGLAQITPRAWAGFLAREVTPRFPDGLTTFDGYGQWRDQRGVIHKEPSKVLLIWYARDATTDTRIEAIRAAFKRRFHQESVLRADGISCVSF